MKPMQRFLIPAVLAAAVLLSAGCEKENTLSAEDVVSVSPAWAAPEVGDSVMFTARGGHPPYRWHLSNDEIGTLTTRGERAFYGADALGGNFIIATDSRGNSGSASIHVPVEPEPETE